MPLIIAICVSVLFIPTNLKLSINNSKNNNNFWFLNTHIFNNKTCQTCDFEQSNSSRRSNSSPNDVIMSIAIRKIDNLEYFIKTLRATGCKATVILFVSNDVINKKSQDEIAKLRNCGVQFINIGEAYFFEKRNIFYFRYICYKNFLQNNIDVVNRVIILDMFDTVFQHDPFKEDFNGDKVFLSYENMSYYQRKWNHNKLLEMIPVLPKVIPGVKIANEDIEELSKLKVFTGGEAFGSCKNILKLCNRMLCVGDSEKLEFIADDQVVLSYLAGTNRLDELFSWTYDNEVNEIFATLYSRDYAMSDYKIGSIPYKERIPAIIHHYNSFDNIQKDLSKVCKPKILLNT